MPFHISIWLTYWAFYSGIIEVTCGVPTSPEPGGNKETGSGRLLLVVNKRALRLSHALWLFFRTLIIPASHVKGFLNSFTRVLPNPLRIIFFNVLLKVTANWIFWDVLLHLRCEQYVIFSPYIITLLFNTVLTLVHQLPYPVSKKKKNLKTKTHPGQKKNSSRQKY